MFRFIHNCCAVKIGHFEVSSLTIQELILAETNW